MREQPTYNQLYYRKNRLRELARVKAYQAANAEKIRVKNKLRYATSEAQAKTRESTKRWAQENPEQYAKIRQRASLTFRLKKHGLTIENYEAMLAAQNGCCAICKSTDPGLGRNGKQGAKRKLKNAWPSIRLHPTIIIWNIDHDHVTGKVRGLICRSCNIAIGAAKDNPELLIAMAKYLVNSRSTGRR
jgi:hypothetical protein